MISSSLLLFFLALLKVVSAMENPFGFIGPSSPMLFLNGFHFISGAPDHYLHVNHHCAIMNADFIQCLVFTPGSNPARMVGIEYIVSGDAFAKFPMEERQLWHSHQFEVTSGLLIEPGLPPGVDKEAMKILVNSYGKTFHTWRFDQKGEPFPYGIPELVNGYTGGGQLPQTAIEQRDEYFGVNSTEIRLQRAGVIEAPPVIEGADSWRYGYVLNFGITNQTSDTSFEGVA